jgi:predicted ATP-binding protein involved in virulence
MTLDNIFSFSKSVSIPLSKEFNLIVGPNNTGKTNIIRIIKTILDTLESPIYVIENSYFFDINKQANIKINLTLDIMEVDAIIGYLYFICTCIRNVHPSKNKEKLRNYFKKMILEFLWNINDENSPPSLQIKIKFENIPLFFLIDNNRSISTYFIPISTSVLNNLS